MDALTRQSGPKHPSPAQSHHSFHLTQPFLSAPRPARFPSPMGTASNRPATQETGSRRWPTTEQRARLALDRQTERLALARSIHPQPLTCIVQDKVAHGKTTRADSTKVLSWEYIRIWFNYLPMSFPSSHRSTFLPLPDHSELEPSTLPLEISVTEGWDFADHANGVHRNDSQQDTMNLVSDHGSCVSMTQEQEKQQRQPHRKEKDDSVPEETESEENHEEIFAFEQQTPQTQDPGSKNRIVPISDFFLLLPTTHRRRSCTYKAAPSPPMLTTHLNPPSSSTSANGLVSNAGFHGRNSSSSNQTKAVETGIQSSDNGCQTANQC